ncbi:diacylglycerol/lipid kinase family protein [Pseudosporangium ferrugineum]|uniref:Diacylglycerol kinase family enzyme n=1 Tax=Pseudosporangium ferrugineum TaxID=439699 RepID=A0A2T0SBS0_9ACTN|nr:diacylglycerol kinase family protein [Pseudosporangium ferrugineum]PRY30856.1 diacylglycerol kinase family enzyme [Pseudosporangium ferrugineum]
MTGHARPAPAQAPAPAGAARAAPRWLARLALLAAAAATVLVLLVGILKGIVLLAVAVIGTAVSLAGAWWFLTHRGPRRWAAGTVTVLGPLTVAILFAGHRLIGVVAAFALLWTVAVAAGRRALTLSGATSGPVEYEVPAPLRPYLIMNPRSGGGKVQRFGLAERARALGAEVVLLGGPPEADVADLAREAVRHGADLLGVAGGDGTQARVAAVAAEHDVPFMVISAGTRNHFALDLGLDREDPARCLDALEDGVEIRVDLGRVGDRTFVNNASFGAYAAIVQSTAYRDDKIGTALDLLPGLLTGPSSPRLSVRVGGISLDGPQAVLISNNPYGSGDIAGLGRRARLDGAMLGILAVKVRGAADATALALGRRRASRALTVLTATEAVVDVDASSVPAGIDGEAVTVPAPARCTVRPGALRVRVPRDRPGVLPPELDWVRLRRLALSTSHG